MNQVTPRRPQIFQNGEIHDWYRIILGFSDHLVADLITEMNLPPGAAVLDPFSGSGTTAVECKKLNVHCWAIDANPASHFAAQVKTNWKLVPKSLEQSCLEVTDAFRVMRKKINHLNSDPTYVYIERSGMFDRNWISKSKLLDVIALKQCIAISSGPSKYRNALMLALMHELVYSASNVRFGPTLYCTQQASKVDVPSSFASKVKKMCEDLKVARQCPTESLTTVLLGDSRELHADWVKPPESLFDGVICSPPYPTEHDYTRNARLELALLESVSDRDTLRAIKQRMIRSNTKGIYKTDDDCELVADHEGINLLASQIEEKAAAKTHGFARLYGRVTRTYFGGMKRHLRSLLPLLKPGATCAYVIGDQASYFRVHIPTAEIVGSLARELGYLVKDQRIWRTRWPTATKTPLQEHILILQKQ